MTMETDTSEASEKCNNDRALSLGFMPQKESVYSTLLPYADDIDKESNAVFSDIKLYLGLAVQRRDMKVGVRHWVVQLERYISVYRFKFSKTDHILLVQLMFDLLMMPSQEFHLVQKFAVVLNHLLRKKTLLTREDLTLPWRPLYEMMKEYLDEKKRWRAYPSKFEMHLKSVIRSCSHYFPDDATQEMLDEWRPWLCPFDTMVISGLQYLDLFLPTTVPSELHHKGFKLWLDEFLQLWHSFHNMPSWEGSLVNLFSRLAHNNIGFIDWTPHVPMIFTRLLRSFCLPVGPRQLIPNRNSNAYDISNVSMWIVGIMGGPDSLIQDHLNKLFKALHSFYHPSNTGKWTLRLGMFLQTLPKFFLRRIRRERYKELAWLSPVPESYKLTETQVTEFVECVKSSVFVAMFSKLGSQDASIALRSLASLRPELFIPPLLEVMYPAMETLIEPHRLIACMICIVSVARPMLTSNKYYPEGKIHVLPLLNLTLPGIDPNDFRKTLVTLQMVSTFVSLVPIVDSSDAIHVRQDLTDHEKELCSATAQFEDFVLAFLDRVQSLIEYSGQEVTFGSFERQTPEQAVLEVGLSSTVSAMLQQCSFPIYKSALKKIHQFVMNNIFEVRVSGKLAANLCRATVRINPTEALKMFVPTLCSSILTSIKNQPAIQDEEQLDNSFLWNLLILSQVVRCNGLYLLDYKDDLISVIKATLVLKSVKGHELAGQLTKFVLQALTLVYALEFRSVTHNFDKPVAEYLPIRDWGTPGDLKDLQMKWHTPSVPEIEMAREIVNAVLVPELTFFHSVKAESNVDREDLLRRLKVVSEVLIGAGKCFMPWKCDEPPQKMTFVESQVPLQHFVCTTGGKQEITVNGENVRDAILSALNHLLNVKNKSMEDDTKSLSSIIKIYETVMLHHGRVKGEFDGRWKTFHVVRNALEFVLCTKKKHLRALLVDRVQLQHELRALNTFDRTYTSTHHNMLNDLLKLSLSRYEQVRKKAQGVLQNAFRVFAYSYSPFVPIIVEHLKDFEVEEHVLKGCLYTILGNLRCCLATKRSWHTLCSLWPAIASAQQSEKPSILRVIDDIMSKLFKGLETFAIKFEMTDIVINSASRLITQSSAPTPSIDKAPNESCDGILFEQRLNDSNIEQYNLLVTNLVDLVNSGKMMWKFHQVALEMLGFLLHEDMKPTSHFVSLFAKNSLSDLVYTRKLAAAALTAILEHQKIKFKKVPVDLKAVAGIDPANCPPLTPGDRPDNQWLKFDLDNFIESEEEWNKVTFIEKTHWGYYTWPKKLKTYAPFSEQPNLNRSREELDEAEQPLFDIFMNDESLSKVFEFLSVEEEKNADKLRPFALGFFKCLFRNYGDTFLEKVKPHVERFVKESSWEKHASYQCCAMEVLGGIILGAKHWTYEKTNSLWTWITPLLQHILNNLTVETLSDWGTFFLQICADRDPHKLQWLYRLLLQDPLSGEGGAFGDAGRLYLLQQSVLQQEWRIPGLLHRLMSYLQPRMAHNYKNVRDRMGCLISSFLQMDFCISPKSQTLSPKRADLVMSVLPELEQFRDVHCANGSEPMQVDQSITETEGTEEKKMAVRLCKTVVQWIATSFAKGMSSCPKELFRLLPIIENLQSEANDEDLRNDCKAVMQNLAQILLPKDIVDNVLAVIKEVSSLKSWHARASILSFTQQLVFGNFFVMQEPSYKQEIQTLILALLCDEQLEVREMAAVTLSGMIHCGYVDMDKSMMNHFEKLRSTKVKTAKGQSTSEPLFLQRLIHRHAGVLGLSACVQAYPYDVPEFIPQVLVDLSVHVNDPQPIGMTVTKTLSNFRRTHHDNWHGHKQMFTDDQLVTLTDLLISPNYYA